MIEIETKKGKSNMDLEEFTRWACLAEAFYFLENKASELDLDLDKLLKPLAIESYVDERYPSMRHDVGIEYMMGNL